MNERRVGKIVRVINQTLGGGRSISLSLTDLIWFQFFYLSGERKEWIKPIMFSGGIGTIDAELIRKNDPKEKMLVVKVGGPVYRIGVGGGAASSIDVQGTCWVTILDTCDD